MAAQDAGPSTSAAVGTPEDEAEVAALYQAAEHLVSCPTEVRSTRVVANAL